ncbi:MAG: thiamine phosphate synthase [Chthoniobacterales bacterium]|nr:thiamine phosphate synthase [Chthoniobacterales bacterium]
MIDLNLGRFYGILDLGYVPPAEARRVAQEMIAGGVDLIQLRAKDWEPARILTLAADLHHTTAAAGIPLIINDHAEIARQIGAEGVHVGQDDQSVAWVREIAGGSCFVGKSTHSVQQAKIAVTEGADYIGFGPLFATPTKPDYVPIGLGDIREVHSAVPLPIFCIGGIKLHNLPQVLAAGAERVVIVSEMLQAPDIPLYIHSVRQLLNQHS